MEKAEIFKIIRDHREDLPFDQQEVDILDRILDRRPVPLVPRALKELQDPERFFKAVREVTKGFDQTQVDTINSILESGAHWPISWVACGLGTAWHECRFRPIEEIGKGRGKKYGRAGARMKAIPNPPKYGGQIPYGRGLVQLTWCDNYEWADRECAKVGLTKPGDILKNFALVMRPDIAAFILVRGMETGAFTGGKLSKYLPGATGTKEQFIQSRRIINGLDKASLIAGHCLSFQQALITGNWK